ncbi:lymphocyte antigen 6D [Myripristis murdjan]|uniref:lymphocyte antigen 6D n=1 Tax=Myripristis murdjan TaxID=586833 RepID=UPI001175CAAB|nr:lymphocyte antigen 6D [Myripristis murdjan]
MKILLLTLLLVLLCSTQVHTLQCYTCSSEQDDICKTETNCPSSSRFCKTVVSADSISRTCEVNCAASENVLCCNEDLCE